MCAALGSVDIIGKTENVLSIRLCILHGYFAGNRIALGGDINRFVVEFGLVGIKIFDKLVDTAFELEFMVLSNSFIDKIDLTADNRLLMALLNNLCDSGTEGIETVLGEFQEEFNSAASYRMVELRESLAQKHSIYGSAVVPNLQADDTWLEEAGALRARFEEKLEAEKNKLE